MFSGFPKELVGFFASLSFHNNRAFFEENRQVYENAVKKPLYELCEALAPTVREIDPLLDTRPVRSVSRIYRDVRFAKDKSPYREYMWIGYRRVGESREDTCGFYFDISQAEAHWGCGFYHAQQKTMQALRDKILLSPRQVMQVLESVRDGVSFDIKGEAYVKKFAPPDTLAPLLQKAYRMKNIYAEHTAENFALVYSDTLADEIAKGFIALAPFYTLLRDCMEHNKEVY